MAIIYTFPLKSVANSSDLVIISDSEDGLKTKTTSIASIGTAINVVDSLNALKGDVTLSAGNNITLGTSGNIITINSTAAGGTVGPGTVNKLSMFTSTTTIGDSIITQDAGPGITIVGNMTVASGSYISTPNILDDAGEFGSASQVLSKSSDNSSILWSTPTGTVGPGTVGTIPVFNGTTTLGNSPFTINTSTSSLEIPALIRHIGDTNTSFGFPSNDKFEVSTNGGTDEFAVTTNNISMTTGTKIKFVANNLGVILYNVRETSVTTSTDRKLETDPDGIKIKGKNNANQPGALADIGGTIKFYSPDNTKYVGVQGPSANDGGNYVLQLPKSVGTTNQVLKLPSSPVSGNNQLEWADAGGSVGTRHLIHDITAADGTVTHNSTTFKQFLTVGEEIDVNTLQCFLLDNTGLSNNTFGLFSGELSKSTAVLLAYGTLNPSPAIPASTLGYNNVPLLDSEGTQTTVRLSVGTNYIIAWSTDTSTNLVGSNGSKGSVLSGPVNVLSNSKAIFTDASAMKSMTATTIASDYTLDGIDCASIVLFKDPTP